MPAAYSTPLIVFGAFLAALAVMWKIGVMPTRSLRLIRRRDDPDSFDAGMTVFFVVIAALLAMGLFAVWVDRNSARLNAELVAEAKKPR